MKSSSLRLLLYNLENFFLFLEKHTGQNIEKISESEWQALSAASVPNKPLKKIWAIKDIITELDPQMLLLVEVGGKESLANFNRHFLNEAYDAYLIEGNSERGIDVGFLIKKDLEIKAQIFSHQQRPLDLRFVHESAANAPVRTYFLSRDIAELRVFAKDSITPSMVVLLTHLKSKLDAEGIDFEGRQRRAAEVNELVKVYNELQVELPNTPKILAGDLNGIACGVHTEPEFIPLQQTDLQEVLSLLELGEQESITQIQFPPGQVCRPFQLDYFFLSPHLVQKVDPTGTFVYRYKSSYGDPLPFPANLQERQQMPSDHYPVVLTLKDIDL